MLDESFALPDGLFHFRIVVGVRLSEPVVVVTDEEEGEEEMVGYYRTYGVTAASAGAAVSLVEELLASRPDDDTAGAVLELDIAVLDTADMELPKPIEEIAAARIHFESGRAFFTAEDDEDDEDGEDDDGYARGEMMSTDGGP